jgi:hypothetical protein
LGPEELRKQSYCYFIDVFVDFFVVVFLFESEEVEEVIPLALFLDVIDIVVDQMHEVPIVHRGSLVPFFVYYVPDMHLFLLRILQHLNLVVEVLYCGEGTLAQLGSPADLAVTLLLHLNTQSLLSLGSLHSSDEVDRQITARLHGLYGADQPEPVDVDATAVGSALVLEVKHLFPNSVAILLDGLINAFLFEDAPLHLVKEFFFGEGPGLSSELLIEVFPLRQAGVALAGQEVNAFLEGLVVEIVVFNLFEKTHERLLKVVPVLMDVNERTTHHHQLKLFEGLFDQDLELPVNVHNFDLL